MTIKKIGYTVNVSREELALGLSLKLAMQEMYGPAIKEQLEETRAMYEQFNDFLPTDPMEWADYQDRQREYEARELYLATLLNSPVLELHWPNDRKECVGCDFSGYEGEPPSWPCRTWNLVMHDNPDYRFENIELTRRYKPGRSPEERAAKGANYVTYPIHARRADNPSD